MSTPTPADRQRSYRRARGISAREISDTPLARARRKRAAGAARFELADDELAALRQYEADRRAQARARARGT